MDEMQRTDVAPPASLADGLRFLRAALVRNGLTFVQLGAALSGAYGAIANFGTYSGGALSLTGAAVNMLPASLGPGYRRG